MKKMVFAVACLTMAGCGGGGGSSSPSTNVSNPIVSSSSSSAVSSSSSSLSSSSASSASSLSSSISSVSSSISSSLNNSLPLGAGTFSTRFVLGGTYQINETTGVITLQEKMLADSYFAADTDSNGMVIAASTTGKNVDEIDLIKGTARTLFNAPEELSALAVGTDGIIVGISKNSEFKKHQVYRFNNSGEVLSKVAIGEYSAKGIDFDSKGILYAVSITEIRKLDPISGSSEVVFPNSQMSGMGDIDIDGNNNLRVINAGNLEIYNLNTGFIIKSVVLQQDYFSFSPLVHR